MKTVTVANVLEAIADDASMELFKLIAATNSGSDGLRSRMKLTRKQYYSRLYKLTQTGLVKRKDNAYHLTAFGKVVYDSQMTLENALANYWKIKAIDSLETADGIPAEEQKKLVSSLIGDPLIKDILMK